MPSTQLGISGIDLFIRSFRMPLFFFVSGIFAYKNAEMNWASFTWLLELLVNIPIATAICFACIGVRKIIGYVPIVLELCFGPDTNKK